MNLRRNLLVALMGLSGLMACGGSGDDSGSAGQGDPTEGDFSSSTIEAPAGKPGESNGSQASGPAAATVEIKEFKFSMPRVEVSAGSSVKWINRDAFKHTVTSGDFSGAVNQPDGKFDEDLDKAGSEAVVTFAEAGTFTYYCRQHNSMNAEVLVK